MSASHKPARARIPNAPTGSTAEPQVGAFGYHGGPDARCPPRGPQDGAGGGVSGYRDEVRE